MAFKRKSKVSADIPAASMSDIAFLLLIFFMTTTIFNVEKGIRLVLPAEGPSLKVKQTHIITVQVAEDGSIYLTTPDGVKPIPSKGLLKDELEKRLAKDSELALIFEVSEKANYEMMIDVFDEIKKANFQRIALKIN
ncbi:MAG TPA: biopolymer transporter ExbD [bacterium]|nr:biopolymer transporter ExbD [bacterium]